MRTADKDEIMADALADAECNARLILGEAREMLESTKVRGNWTPGIVDEIDEIISDAIHKLIKTKSTIGTYRAIANSIRYQRS